MRRPPTLDLALEREGAAPTRTRSFMLGILEEAVRDRVPFGGFPWGRLAFSQADSPLRWFAKLPGGKKVLRRIYREIACRRSCDNGACLLPEVRI